jgi:hypothetical protein
MPFSVRACPFCGLGTDVNHETQEGCIAALHAEIERMRDVLASLKPSGVRPSATLDDDRAKPTRLALD